jgi:hypothetical protein
MLLVMRRLGWPLTSMLLALSACNALTGASDLSTCTTCDEVPGVDAAIRADAKVPEASVLDGALRDVREAAAPADTGTAADAGAEAGNGCQGAAACPRIVFVTSATYQGNLGGIAGADAKCQAAADASLIVGVKARTFRAWVSTSASSVSTRLTHGTQAYLRVDEIVVASDWTDLTNGTIQAPIHVDEQGDQQNSGAGTATDSAGADFTGSACGDFTSSLIGTKGTRGNVGGSGGGWSSGGDDDCSTPDHLYCVEY